MPIPRHSPATALQGFRERACPLVAAKAQRPAPARRQEEYIYVVLDPSSDYRGGGARGQQEAQASLTVSPAKWPEPRSLREGRVPQVGTAQHRLDSQHVLPAGITSATPCVILERASRTSSTVAVWRPPSGRSSRSRRRPCESSAQAITQTVLSAAEFLHLNLLDPSFHAPRADYRIPSARMPTR